jgi:hypothetical protein
VSDRLQFIAAIVNSLAWPTAVVVVVRLLRRELADAFHRMQTFEFAGTKATFATLAGYEKIIEAVAKDAGAAPDVITARTGVAEFSVLQTLASAAPKQAVIDAWGLLEYQLNVASDRLAPDGQHGWPQVARNLELWPMWERLLPAVQELRRLRDYTVRSKRQPSSADAARYVGVVQDLVTTIRTSNLHESGDGLAVANERYS